MPGYPAFLALIYSALGRTRLAVMLAQAAIDLVTCVLAALIAKRIAPAAKKSLAATIALWLAALCPFTASYTGAIVTETLAAFFTTRAADARLDFHRARGRRTERAANDAPGRRPVRQTPCSKTGWRIRSRRLYRRNRNTGAARNAARAGRGGGCGLHSLAAHDGLAEDRACWRVDGGRPAGRAHAVGGAERANSRPHRVSRAALCPSRG